ncbi:MAG: hypothetical protein JNL21_23340 [Myxococcales bacterium]|nr:hypothetical protein [Myxococcales bacterium]
MARPGGPFILGALGLGLGACVAEPARGPSPAGTSVPSAFGDTATPAPSAAVASAESERLRGPNVPARRIALGERMGCSVLVDGGLACWGIDVGATPSRVAGISDAEDVAVGDDVVVLRRGGGVSVFVGGDLASSPMPLIEGARSIAAHGSTLCAVRDDRRVACWQGGVRGTSGAPRAPRVARLERVVSLAVGAQACAVVESGRVSCFQPDTSSAWTLPGVQRATAVSVGLRRVCALHKDDATTTLDSAICFDFDNPARSSVLMGIGEALAITAPQSTDTPLTCVGHREEIECKRRSTFGPLMTPPTQAGVPEGTVRLPAGRKVKQLAAARRAICALDDAGIVRCWGQNAASLLGLPDTQWVARATKVEGAPPLRSIAAGRGFTCGLSTKDEVVCWGSQRRAASETKPPRLDPPRTIPGSAGAARLFADAAYACWFTKDGAASCFYAERTPGTPVRVPALDGARELALPPFGIQAPVALVDASGKLRIGTTANAKGLEGLAVRPVDGVTGAHGLALRFGPVPGTVLPDLVFAQTDGGIVAVEVERDGTATVAPFSTCSGTLQIRADGLALFSGGKVARCMPGAPPKTLVNASPLVAIAPGNRVCGTTGDGKFGCIAHGRFVPHFETFVQLASSDSHDCVVDAKGETWCRGDNDAGQCGTDAGTFRAEEPVELHFE